MILHINPTHTVKEDFNLTYKKLLGDPSQHFIIALGNVASLRDKVNLKARFSKCLIWDCCLFTLKINVDLQAKTKRLLTSRIMAVVGHQEGNFRHRSSRLRRLLHLPKQEGKDPLKNCYSQERRFGVNMRVMQNNLPKLRKRKKRNL